MVGVRTPGWIPSMDAVSGAVVSPSDSNTEGLELLFGPDGFQCSEIDRRWPKEVRVKEWRARTAS
jgi:hypothetical protein